MKAGENLRVHVRGAEVWPLSVEAYHALGETGLIPERTELLYGFVYHKMSKSPLRTFLMLRLMRLLQSVLPPRVHLRPKQPLTCVDSEPEPDFALVLGAEGDFRTAHPKTAELVIEICVSSAEYDRSKLRAYATAGVRECWLVMAREKQIEVHYRPQGARYAERISHGHGARLTSAAVPEVTVDLSKLFESV